MNKKKIRNCINCGPVETWFLCHSMCTKCYKVWWLIEHPPEKRSRKFHDGEVRRTNKWRSTHDRHVHDHKYYETHKDQVAEYRKKWAAENKDKLRARDAKRRALELHACPSWADLEAIKAIYAEARRLTQETGIFYHVDHIYPLVSPYVCGLHVPENLQIIPWTENLIKGNKI